MSEQDTKNKLNKQEVILSIIEKGYYEYTFTFADKPLVLRTLVMDNVMESERLNMPKENELFITHSLTLNQLSYVLQRFGDKVFTKPEDTLEWLKKQSSQMVEGFRRRFNALENEVSNIIGNQENLTDFFQK
jgi:hypothetical protein